MAGGWGWRVEIYSMNSAEGMAGDHLVIATLPTEIRGPARHAVYAGGDSRSPMLVGTPIKMPFIPITPKIINPAARGCFEKKTLLLTLN